MPGVQFLVGKRFFSSPQHSNRLCGNPVPYPLSTEGYFSCGKAAYQPPPSGAEVKNSGAISPLLHISSWHGAELIKQRTTLPFLSYNILCDVLNLYNC
jgi:hypothetical protein